MQSEWERGLNPEQIQAVRHNHGPMLILAGAGSGKTTVLVARTGRLIDEGVAKPNRICVLTFTNKAARELKERVAQKVGKGASKIWAGTFHSFGLQVLKTFYKEAGLPKGFGVIDNNDSTAILREFLSNIKSQSKDAYDPATLLNLIGEWRTIGRTKARSEDDYEVMTEILLPKYLERMKEMGVVDFEELLLGPIQLMKSFDYIRKKVGNYFDQVMVDEFQDTNHSQMKIIEELAGNSNNLSVVGDDDQSIYGWRGAEVRNILDFPKKHLGCHVVKLEQNYRSTPQILNLANSVIKANKDRHGKVLESSSGLAGNLPELFVYESEDQEVEKVVREIQRLHRSGLRHSEIAVIYRSNSQGGFLESELRAQNVPYKITGGLAFFDQKESKDVLSYIRSAFAPNEVALRRIINTPARGIGSTTIQRISDAATKNGISFVSALHQISEEDLPEKGLEKVNSFKVELSQLQAALLNGERGAGTELVRHMTANGFKENLEKQSKKPEAFYKKWRSVETLGNILDRFVEKGGRNRKTFQEFLESMELRDTQEDEEKKDEVNLMTLHASKGLEFPAVVLLGLEEDILPHRTLGSDISEERRLLYVGITRAKSKLIMTRCLTRRRHGQMKPSTPSRFIQDFEKERFVEHHGDRPMKETDRKKGLEDLFSQISRTSESKRIL